MARYLRRIEREKDSFIKAAADQIGKPHTPGNIRVSNGSNGSDIEHYIDILIPYLNVGTLYILLNNLPCMHACLLQLSNV
ncbi:hypothetical protein ACN38_g10593 [Penicillium nordicum]|uniref:Uncharacterized protein n=1 Tax=Penicillium nordicum TaxID=229535 RepID=A0A0M9WBN9_9EURO|nr:hypothetical protein ACN38_g10593 [Penicillium nordicum]